MLDRATNRLRILAPPPLPVEAMMLGKPVAEVVEVMPRLFNLCRAAQSEGLQMTLGLTGADPAALAQDIARDHAVNLALRWPKLLGIEPQAIDLTNLGGVLGPQGFPDDMQGFEAYLGAGQGVAPILTRLEAQFKPGEACVSTLPFAAASKLHCHMALENSVAIRHPGHPILQHIEARFGRGPLWRVVARAVDLSACLAGRLPPARLIAEDTALVPASRGTYLLQARAEAGHLTALNRITPTDHMLAPGGMAEQTLASLPSGQHDRARLALAILDPCVPLQLEEAPHA